MYVIQRSALRKHRIAYESDSKNISVIANWMLGAEG
jgi:hypothetical protein